MRINQIIIVGVIACIPMMGHAAARRSDASHALRIVYLRNAVQICDTKGACSKARLGQILTTGEKVKVGSRSKAILRSGKDTIELRHNTTMVVDHFAKKKTSFNLLVGTLKAKIRGMWFGRKQVSIITPVSVMAVRGTGFMCTVSPSGAAEIQVFDGRVDVLNKFTGKRMLNVIQGESGKFSTATTQAKEGDADTAQEGMRGDDIRQDGPGMEDQQEDRQSDDQDQETQDQQQPGDDEQKKQHGEVFLQQEQGELSQDGFEEAFGGEEGFNDFQNARDDNIRDVQGFEQDQSAIGNVVQVVRENDLASGRTLVDIHGNLTRVEQRLFRPSGDTIQFVNLIKRDGYSYHGFFGYSGSGGGRRDILQSTIQFDRSLPENIGEWPSFFADNASDLKILSASMKASNTRDFMLSETAYNPTKNEIGGTICGDGQIYRTNCFQRIFVGYTDTVNNVKYQVKNCDHTSGSTSVCVGGEVGNSNIDIDGSDGGDLWATIAQPVKLIAKAAETDAGPSSVGDTLWILTESYALNNSGSILNINTILDGEITEPFAYMRTLAGESIFTVRHSLSGAYNKDTNSGTSFFTGTRSNIDLLIIPDLMVDLVQKYAIHLADQLD
ncbi:FecR domain-containing protein [Elusimicrobiota bacterium]